MRVLVCGGRNYEDKALVDEVLSHCELTVLIHGDCPTGVDRLVDEWARSQDEYIHIEQYPADWKKYGRPAGPIRNQQMLNEGKPDLVIAFPGGRGTADMVRRAKAEGVEVHEV